MTRRSVVFGLLALAFSWLAWGPLAAHALGWIAERPSPYLHLLGGLGPAAAALVLSIRERRARELAHRCVLAPPRWIAVAVLGPIALYLVAAAVLRVAGATIDLSATGRGTEYPGLGVVAYVLANILAYGLGEEIGWRGYLAPHLQRRMSFVRASLIIAGIWAVWHLPLFAFADGMSVMGPFEIAGWLVSLAAGSLLMTALFHASGGSVLVVALFHGSLDVLINSPTGGPLQTTMGALATVAGLTLPFAIQARRRDRAG